MSNLEADGKTLPGVFPPSKELETKFTQHKVGKILPGLMSLSVSCDI